MQKDDEQPVHMRFVADEGPAAPEPFQLISLLSPGSPEERDFRVHCLIAHRTREWSGCDDVVFDIDPVHGHPVKATATVYRYFGFNRITFTTSVLWDEYYPGPGLWSDKPRMMLGKVAMTAALAMAFPESGTPED